MSVRIIAGDGGVVQLENRRGYRFDIGHTLIKQYRGPESVLGTFLETLIGIGGVRDASIDHDVNGLYILSAVYSAESATGTGGTEVDTSVVRLWTRDRSREERTLWTAPPWVTLTNTLSPMAAAGLRAAIQDYLEGSATISILEDVLVANGLTLANATISQLVDHFRKGIETYPFERFVITRTEVGPLQYLANNDATISRMWSRDSLVALTGITADFAVRIPNGYFLQGASILSQIDLYKWQSVTTWDHGTELDDWIYGAAI